MKKIVLMVMVAGLIGGCKLSNGACCGGGEVTPTDSDTWRDRSTKEDTNSTEEANVSTPIKWEVVKSSDDDEDEEDEREDLDEDEGMPNECS